MLSFGAGTSKHFVAFTLLRGKAAGIGIQRAPCIISLLLFLCVRQIKIAPTVWLPLMLSKAFPSSSQAGTCREHLLGLGVKLPKTNLEVSPPYSAPKL